MSKRSPRLQFTDEERTAPELEKVIRKADKAADKVDKAEAKIPKKTVKKKKSVSWMAMAKSRYVCILRRSKRKLPPNSLIR